MSAAPVVFLNKEEYQDASHKSLMPLEIVACASDAPLVTSALLASGLICTDEAPLLESWAGTSNNSLATVLFHKGVVPIGKALRLEIGVDAIPTTTLDPIAKLMYALSSSPRTPDDLLSAAHAAWDSLFVHVRTHALSSLPRTARVMVEAVLSSDDPRVWAKARRYVARHNRKNSRRALLRRNVLYSHMISALSPLKFAPVIALPASSEVLVMESLDALSSAGLDAIVIPLSESPTRALFRYATLVLPQRLSSRIVICPEYPLKKSLLLPSPAVVAVPARLIATSDPDVSVVSRRVAAEDIWAARARFSRVVRDASPRSVAAAAALAVQSRTAPTWFMPR